MFELIRRALDALHDGVDATEANFERRPGWMNALLVFCAYMTFIQIPWDLFWKPVEQDQQVWLGFVLHGWWAKLTTPLHWAIYGAGTYGFWHMKSWMHPWAMVYVGQVGIGMLVWFGLDERSPSAWLGVVLLGLFAALGWAFWRQRERFTGPPAEAAG